MGSRAKKGSSGVCSGSGAEWGGSAGRRLGRWARTGPQPQAALRLVSEGWPARGWGMGGEPRLCWGRTKGEDKDYFKPVLITAPNRDWGWEPQLSQGAGEGGGRESTGRGWNSELPQPGPGPSPAVSLRPHRVSAALPWSPKQRKDKTSRAAQSPQPTGLLASRRPPHQPPLHTCQVLA